MTKLILSDLPEGQEINLTRGGQPIGVRGTPQYYRKTIVVVGSSVAAGSGASVAANGWANLTLASLASLGWDTHNVSIGGDTTAAVIARFYTDVAPLNPDIVVIALGLGNEISADTDENDYNRMVRNMRQLVRMVRQQGAVPVISGPYPRATFTAAQIVYNNQLGFEYDAMGIPWINFASIDTGSDWVASAKSDEAHPNDTGHAEMAKCVELSMFDHLLYSQNLVLPKSKGCLRVNTTTPTASAPVLYTPKTVFGSFTAFFRIRNAGSLNNLSMFGIGTNTTIRIRNADPGAYSYVADDDASFITSTVNGGADNKEHSICVKYNALTTVTTLYIDGISIGTVTDPVTPANIAIGCRFGHSTYSQLCEFRDMAVYRTALTDRQVLQAHKGEFSKGSLEFFNSLGNLDTTMTHIHNYAPTDNWAVLDTAANVVTAVSTRHDTVDVPVNIIGTILNQKYVIIPKATFNGRIQHLIQEATSLGTAGNYTVKINSTDVTGLATKTNTTAVTDSKATGAYDFVVGDEISITFASTVALVDFFGSMLITRFNTD